MGFRLDWFRFQAYTSQGSTTRFTSGPGQKKVSLIIRSLMKVLPKHHVICVNNLILQNKCISFIFIHLLLTTNQNCLITHQNYLSSVGIKICSKDYFKNLFKILQPQDIRFHSQARFRSGIVGPSKSDEFGL